jgi:hypothetical protein
MDRIGGPQAGLMWSRPSQVSRVPTSRQFSISAVDVFAYEGLEVAFQSLHISPQVPWGNWGTAFRGALSGATSSSSPEPRQTR